MEDKDKVNLDHAIHYLDVLQENYSVMQYEVREAIDIAIVELKKLRNLENDN